MLGLSKYSRMAKRQRAPSLNLDRTDVVSTSYDDPSGTEGAVFLGHSSHVQRSGRGTQSYSPNTVNNPAEDQEPLSTLSKVLSGSKVSRP